MSAKTAIDTIDATVEGMVEILTPTRIEGWAFIRGASEKLSVDVVQAGTLVATGLADRVRTDIALVREVDDQCGFRIALPENFIPAPGLILRVRGIGVALRHHPRVQRFLATLSEQPAWPLAGLPAEAPPPPAPVPAAPPASRLQAFRGLHGDGWALVDASLRIVDCAAVTLRLFVPPLAGPGEPKALFIFDGTRTHRLLLMRGEVRVFGPLPAEQGVVDLQLYCAGAEARTEADQRPLGVLIAEITTERGVVRVPITAKGQSEEAPKLLHPQTWAIESELDPGLYRAGFPEGEAPIDPILHYLAAGWLEGRDPAPAFSTRHYLAMHDDVRRAGVNPFVHFVTQGRREGRRATPIGQAVSPVFAAQHFATNPGPLFERADPTLGLGRTPRAKVLAYYLPQFHAVPENEKFWGEGFTEWRNVAKGSPRFKGHVQPRIPRDLGFYDLAEGDAMRRQIEMARAAGLHGFCFYYYWFDGKRVLDRPVERLLADASLDMPFTLMWANDNWTRTWDGHDSEILLQQSYRPEDDAALIDDFARHFFDPRYIRLGERPLLFIYRPGHVPDAPATFARWRQLFATRHGIEPLIYMAQGFGDLDPRAYGLDGAIEFPPHKLCQGQPTINHTLEIFDAGFTGRVLDYDAMVEQARAEPEPVFPLIRTTTPMWDNEARRPGRGMTIFNSTPAKFEAWMAQSIDFARRHPTHGEAIVCVNAWNEWAEGATLEPDVHYGAAYLNALARAVFNVPSQHKDGRHKLLIVGHDAHRNGAQMLALNMARTYRRQFGLDVAILLRQGGPLLDAYREIGPVQVVGEGEAALGTQLRRMSEAGFAQALVNSTASGALVEPLKRAGFQVLTLVHEQRRLIEAFDLGAAAASISRLSDHVIFPAAMVRDQFLEVAGPAQGKVEVDPQGLYMSRLATLPRGDGGLRAELGLAPNARLIINVGYADLRKGIDRFIATAIAVCAQRPNVYFFWVGAPAPETQWHLPDVAQAGLAGRIRLIGHVEDVSRWYAASDLVFLTSREDPFPSVVMEALAVGLPVVGYQGTGGCDALIARHGRLVNAANPMAAIRAIGELLNLAPAIAEAGALARREEIRRDFQFDSYCFRLLQRLDPTVPSVSVVLPNYNYERYLALRLGSIFGQSLPVLEVIVLDDASPDGSVAEIGRICAREGRDIRLEVNAVNTGSPFPQWRKGLRLARGEYVWIAEADDVADPRLLDTLVRRMHATGAVLGFCDSSQMDEEGDPLGASYKPYVNQIRPGAFDHSFVMEGPEFLASFLAVKNVILNVSGVVFRREALLAAMQQVGAELDGMGVAGDWRLYAEICAGAGRVVYEAAALNAHRRHRTSVTHALKASRHLREIADMQALVATQVPLSEQTRAQQAAFLAEARAYLGLAETQLDVAA